MANETICGCKTKKGEGIVFCSTHKNAGRMLQALAVLRNYYAKEMPESPFIGIIDRATDGVLQ